MKLALLKSKLRAPKTEENEIKSLKVTAMLFNFVFLCLFWRFVPRESGIFEMTVGIKDCSLSLLLSGMVRLLFYELRIKRAWTRLLVLTFLKNLLQQPCY